MIYSLQFSPTAEVVWVSLPEDLRSDLKRVLRRTRTDPTSGTTVWKAGGEGARILFHEEAAMSLRVDELARMLLVDEIVLY